MMMARIGVLAILALLAGCANDGSNQAGSANVHVNGVYTTMFGGVVR